jgi:hypothetical protein
MPRRLTMIELQEIVQRLRPGQPANDRVGFLQSGVYPCNCRGFGPARPFRHVFKAKSVPFISLSRKNCSQFSPHQKGMIQDSRRLHSGIESLPVHISQGYS